MRVESEVIYKFMTETGQKGNSPSVDGAIRAALKALGLAAGPRQRFGQAVEEYRNDRHSDGGRNRQDLCHDR